MQWSKLKTRLKSLIHPDLSSRIDFHITSFRQSHDGVDKVWITLDGIQIFSCGHYDFEFAEREGYHRGLSSQEVARWLEGQGICSPQQIVGAMRAYLDMAIEDAWRSDDPFISALAVLDRRVGKSRLAAMPPEESAHSLVKQFYELRCGRA